MPERIALQRITIGEEGPDGNPIRRYVMPRERFTVTDAQAKDLDGRNPPIVRDPRARETTTTAEEDEGAEQMERVASREELAGRDTRQPSAEALAAGAAVARAQGQTQPPRGNSNTTREPPPGEKDDL